MQGVHAYREQYQVPRESPTALSGPETAERTKDEGLGCRLEPLITYSFHLLPQLFQSSLSCFLKLCPLGIIGVPGEERQV